MRKESPIIVCDTNAILWLYESRSKDVLHLLEVLEKMKSHMFIPKQICNEVMRRKMNCIHSCHWKGLEIEIDALRSTIKAGIIPEHIVNTEDNAIIKEWNTNYKKYQDSTTKLRKDLKKAYAVLHYAVVHSEDSISRLLNSIFGAPEVESENQLKRAQERALRGNPPGKPNGPIGDQIVWEQMIDVIKEHPTAEVWLVTKDSDFVVLQNGTSTLNPFLQSELWEVTKGVKDGIRTFTNIIEMVEAFKNEIDVGIENNLQEKGLQTLATEIQHQRDICAASMKTGIAMIPLGTTYDQLRFGFIGEYWNTKGTLFDELTQCPRCGKTYQRSQGVGGALLCPHCMGTDPYWLDE